MKIKVLLHDLFHIILNKNLQTAVFIKRINVISLTLAEIEKYDSLGLAI